MNVKSEIKLIEVIIKKDTCKGCGLCVEVCPKGLITITSGDINKKGYPYAVFGDPEGKCTCCAQCAIICPDVAIEIRKSV